MKTINFNQDQILPIERGGTGATTAIQARSNLEITPANIGAASATHNHNAPEITGTLLINQGGTGANSAAQARNNLGITPENIGAIPVSHLSVSNPHNITPSLIGAAAATHTHLMDNILGVLPTNKGGTGAATISEALTNLGAAPVNHNHTGSQISGNIPGNAANITGICAITNGGTGANTAAQALANLGAAPANHSHTGSQISGNIPGNAANITGICAITNGGTGANTAAQALANLGAAPANHSHHTGTKLTFNFNSGWNHYNSDFELEIYKIFNVVFINGLVRRSPNFGNDILQIPLTNFRPQKQIMSIVWGFFNSNYQNCRVDVYPNGIITLVYPGGTTTISIVWLQLHFVYVTAN